jgi:hypothetical protein
MFKKKTLVLILALLIMGIGASVAQAEPAVILDGQQLSFDVAPVIDNGRTLVPLRAIFESLGANVEWDSVTSTVTATRSNTNIRLQIGNTTAYKNGMVVILDVPGKLIQNRTMVPLRFVGEALGCNITWNASSYAVEITSKEKMLLDIYDYVVIDLWNDGFNNIKDYLNTGKDSCGQDLDIELTKSELSKAMKKKPEYDQYINNLGDEYSDIKIIWGKLSPEADKLFAQIEGNTTSLNVDFFRQYMDVLLDNINEQQD